MDLTDEAGRASTRRPDPARNCLPAATIADLAGMDAKIVFVACHETTVGSRKAPHKGRNAIRVIKRRNPCASEGAAILISSTSRAMALGTLKENDNWKKRRSPISMARPKPT
jgi:hypothetical protein